MRRPFQTAAALIAALLLTALSAAPAHAYPPVDIVHTEKVKAGPYTITVGFSVWPLRAMRSLDFTFVPDGGIHGKRATIAMTGPEGEDEPRPMARHPRKREVWGMDTTSLDSQGTWSFAFAVEGPQGRGEGVLKNIAVLEQPGPPLALSWAIGTIPLWCLIALLAVAWRRTGTARAPAPA
ncbi:hypothetical protein [Sinosporangium siamense]|uniref:CopC domain-containing protein n=1 Tax=Sinosporangium siamense TaxID=1367973 RepID=A0A919RP74_9ACTN|nr:hypothetical protein [Sinosporangium siamense]GII97390.1 hypothetical protein Ssi02_76210 [Sinosporangium siamense]